MCIIHSPIQRFYLNNILNFIGCSVFVYTCEIKQTLFCVGWANTDQAYIMHSHSCIALSSIKNKTLTDKTVANLSGSNLKGSSQYSSRKCIILGQYVQSMPFGILMPLISTSSEARRLILQQYTVSLAFNVLPFQYFSFVRVIRLSQTKCTLSLFLLDQIVI